MYIQLFFYKHYIQLVFWYLLHRCYAVVVVIVGSGYITIPGFFFPILFKVQENDAYTAKRYKKVKTKNRITAVRWFDVVGFYFTRNRQKNLIERKYVQNETKIRPPIMATINVMAKLSNGCGGVGPVRSQRRRIVSEPADSLVSQVIFIEIDTH